MSARLVRFCLMMTVGVVGCNSSKNDTPRGPQGVELQQAGERPASQGVPPISMEDETSGFGPSNSPTLETGPPGAAGPAVSGSLTSKREQELDLANRLNDQAKYRQAAEILKRLLLADPGAWGGKHPDRGGPRRSLPPRTEGDQTWMR